MSLFCFLFWHRWRAQAVERLERYANVDLKEKGFPSSSHTRVLYRCTRCPRHRVQELDGHWTLEQLILGEEMRDPRVQSPTSR